MSTYSKNGMIHGRFNPIRNGKYDDLGKKFATLFFEAQGGIVSENDLDAKGNRLFENPDIKVEFPHLNKTMFVEVEIKSNKNWSYIFSGIDIPARKLKYSIATKSQGFFFMGKEDCQELMLISMKHMQNAADDCGDAFLGQSSKWGQINTSESFVIPKHECYRVRKHCFSEGSVTVEDFFRIPYKYSLHYSLNENKTFLRIT